VFGALIDRLGPFKVLPTALLAAECSYRSSTYPSPRDRFCLPLRC